MTDRQPLQSGHHRLGWHVSAPRNLLHNYTTWSGTLASMTASTPDAADEPRPGSRTVELPEHLAVRVERRLDRTTYETVEGYVAFVLAETLGRVEAADEEPVDVDEAEIQERLESLGYLDS